MPDVLLMILNDSVSHSLIALLFTKQFQQTTIILIFSQEYMHTVSVPKHKMVEISHS